MKGVNLMKRGSEESKAYMAALRGMRKKKALKKTEILKKLKSNVIYHESDKIKHNVLNTKKC